MPNESGASARADGRIGELSDQGRDGQTQHATTEQRQEVSSWKTALDDPLIVFTGLLVIVTAGMWFFTYRLWKATAKMAKEAAISAREARLAEFRPHIKMRRFSITKAAPDEGGQFVVTIDATNWGRGTAKIANSHVAIYDGRDLPPMLDYWQINFPWNHPFKIRKQSDHEGLVEDVPVLPGQSIQIEWPFDVTPEQYAAFWKGQLWIVGFITYADTSDDQRKYHTDFARHIVSGRFSAAEDEGYESAP